MMWGNRHWDCSCCHAGWMNEIGICTRFNNSTHILLRNVILLFDRHMGAYLYGAESMSNQAWRWHVMQSRIKTIVRNQTSSNQISNHAKQICTFTWSYFHKSTSLYPSSSCFEKTYDILCPSLTGKKKCSASSKQLKDSWFAPCRGIGPPCSTCDRKICSRQPTYGI